MAIHYTSVLALPWMDTDTELNQLDAVTQELAETMETALIAHGIAPADISDLIAAGWFTDSGWVDVTIGSGFAAQDTTNRPRVRKRAGVVHLKGGWANTGMAANATVSNVGTIPSGYRPNQTIGFALGGSNGTADGVMLITSAGAVEIRTGAALPSYYKADGQQWLTD
jgi:hypothetical protein